VDQPWSFPRARRGRGRSRHPDTMVPQPAGQRHPPCSGEHETPGGGSHRARVPDHGNSNNEPAWRSGAEFHHRGSQRGSVMFASRVHDLGTRGTVTCSSAR
jgi:hypothetical protein